MTAYETLKDMQYHQHLQIRCICGHASSLSQAQAIVLFGPDATPFDIRRRMRCSRCHEVGKVDVTY